MFSSKVKKIVAIILIIAMSVTSAGFTTLANSVDSAIIIANETDKKEITTKCYKEENQDTEEETTEAKAEEDESTTIEDLNEDKNTTKEENESLAEEMEPEEDETTTVGEEVVAVDETTGEEEIIVEESETTVEESETTAKESSEEETTTTVGASDDEGNSAGASSANPNTETTTAKKVEDEETTTIESSSEESTSGTIESSSEESTSGTDATFESSSTSDGKKDASTEQSIAPTEKSDVETATVSETNENIGDSTNVATDSETTEVFKETSPIATKINPNFNPASISELKPIDSIDDNKELFGAYTLSDDVDDDLWVQLEDLFNSNTILTIGSDIASPDTNYLAVKRDSSNNKVLVAEDDDRHYGSIADYWYVKGKWGWTVGRCMPYTKNSNNVVIGRNRFLFLGCIGIGFHEGNSGEAQSMLDDAWNNETNDKGTTSGSDWTKLFYYWPTYIYNSASANQMWKNHSNKTGWFEVGSSTYSGAYNINDFKASFKSGNFCDTQVQWPSNSSYFTDVPRGIADKVRVNNQLKNQSFKELTIDKVSFSNTNGALSGNSNLEKVTFTTNADIAGITDATSFFENDTKLTSVVMNKENGFNSITNATKMFKGCTSLKNISFTGNMKMESVTNTESMFEGCTALETVDLGNMPLSSLTNTKNMFNGCSSLKTIKVGSLIYKLSDSVDATNMFAGCSNLKGPYNFSDTSKTGKDFARVGLGGLLPGYFTYTGSSTVGIDFKKITLPSTSIKSKTQIKKIKFLNGASVPTYDTNGNVVIYTIDGVDCYGQIQGDTLQIHCGNSVSLKWISDYSSAFEGWTALETIEGLDMSNIDYSTVSNVSKLFNNANLTSITLSNNFCPNATDFSEMFAGNTNLTTVTIGNAFNSTDNINMEKMFEGCTNLTTINLPANFGNRTTNMESMFEGTKISSYPTNLNVNAATNMKNMFKDCRFLTTFVTPTGFNPSAATNMSNMFSSCSNVTKIDLKASTFTNLTDASNMFNGCSALTEVKVNTNIRNLPAGATTTDMFAGCTNLKGGGGFKYDPNHTSGEYARVDYGGILPGYFTSNDESIYNTISFDINKTWVDNITKTDITKVVFSTASTIEDYENEFNLKTMDTSLDTKAYLKDGGATLVVHIAPQIKDLIADADWSEFFANFSNLQRIEHFDVIDTTNVVNASKAFYNCTSIITIDMSDIKIENIQNLESAFEGCTSLAGFTGKIATFSSLTNARKTFKDCTSLQIMSFDICDTPTLTTTEEMFAGCTNLARIYTNDNFQGLHGINYTDMFKDCVNLVGGQGFGYNPTDPNAGSGEFARIDYGGIMPGYYSLIDPSIYNTATFTVPTDWFHSTTKNKDEITEVVFFNDAPVPGGGSAIGHYDEMFYINPVNKSRAYIDGNKVKFHYGHSINQLKVDGDASGFFKGFTNLTHVEGLEEKVDVTNVTNISELFSGCSNLVEVNLNPNTEHVTNMEKVFYGCEKLEKVTIGNNLKLDKVTNLESAFEGCKKLNTLNVGITSFSSVENLKNAFKDCESLIVFSFDVCNTPTLATTSGMFSGCKNLRRIYVNDNFQGLQHIAYDNMFDGCINLIGGEGFAYSPTVPECKSGEFARVDYGGIMPGYYTIINTAKYHDVVFDLETDWYKSTTLPKEEVKKIKFFNTPQSEGGIGAYDEMFYMSNADKTRVYVEASTKTIKFHYGHDIDTLKFQGDVEGMFADFINLEEIEGIEKLDASRIVNMSAMFAGCKNMKHLTIPNGLINATTLSEAFKDCSSLETVTFGSDVRVENVTTLDGMFENCTSLKSIDFGTSFDISKVTNMERMFKNCESLTEIKLNQKLTTAKIENMNEMFAGCKNITDESIRVFGVLDVRNVKEMNYTFASCSNLTDLSFGVIEADKIESMEGMFAGCENLTNITFGGSFNTNNAVNMSHMFEGCTKLQGERIDSKTKNANTKNEKEKSNFLLDLLKLNDNDELFGAPEQKKDFKILDLSGLKTDSVTNMKGMFADCAEIDVVLLPNINTENVEDMSEMFANCSGLRFIVARDFATASVIHSEDMFKNCPKLMGGEGTKWIDTQVLDKEYAVVDMGAKSGKVGYLTWGNAHIKYNPGEGAEGTMDDDVVERFKTYSLSANGFTKNGYTFANWMDEEGNTYRNREKVEVGTSITLTAKWIKNGGNNPGPSGGGGGGGGNGGGTLPGGGIGANSVEVGINTPITLNEYVWISTSDESGKIFYGIKILKTSALAKTLMSNSEYAKYYKSLDEEYIQLKNGIFNIQYLNQFFYYAFDFNGNMFTGIITAKEGTKLWAVDETTGTLVESGSISGNKYLFYDGAGEFYGIMWTQPITYNNVEYTFDATGKIISEKSLTNTNTNANAAQGQSNVDSWEFDPLNNSWKYFEVDASGNRTYLKNTAKEINTNGGSFWYIFDENGNMKTGLTEYKGNTYYLQETGANRGAITTGVIVLNGISYTFDSAGCMVSKVSALTGTQQ